LAFKLVDFSCYDVGSYLFSYGVLCLSLVGEHYLTLSFSPVSDL